MSPEKIDLDGEARLYADERGEYLAFKVTEDRLVTRLAAAEVIRDMVSVAQHRQWEALHVRGSVEFRREAWLEAGARGIEVQGYQPTDLDRQALSDRQEASNRTHPHTHEVEVRSGSDKDRRGERLDYDRGVSGRLIEVGRAPYRNHDGAETSAYVAIELDNGRQHQVWGVGLEKATTDSRARPGDRIQVRRDGVDRVAKDIKVIDAASGSARIERRQVPRNRWRVTAEKFRATDRADSRSGSRPGRGTVTNGDHREVARTRVPKGRARTSEHHGSGQGAHRPTPREGAFVCASDSHGARSRAPATGTRQRRARQSQSG